MANSVPGLINVDLGNIILRTLNNNSGLSPCFINVAYRLPPEVGIAENMTGVQYQQP